MKTLVLTTILAFPGLLLADLSESDFKILKRESATVNRENAKVSSLLYNEQLTEEQFQTLKTAVGRMKESVDKMEKTVQKTEKKVFTDNSWYWDVQKGVYWRQLSDGKIETKPIVLQPAQIFQSPVFSGPSC